METFKELEGMGDFRFACKAFNVMKCTQIKCLNLPLFKSRYCNIFGHSRLSGLFIHFLSLLPLSPEKPNN